MNKNIDLEKKTIEIVNGFSLEGMLIINHKFEIIHIEEQLKYVLGFEKDEMTFNFFKNPASEFRIKLTACFIEKTPCSFRQYIREREKWFKFYVFPFKDNFIIHFNELSYLLDLEHKFSALLDSTADFNVLVDLDYQIVSYNKSSEIFAKDVLQKDLKIGDSIYSGKNIEISIGNSLPLDQIPLGTDVHNVELFPGKGGQIIRSAGTSAKILAKENNYVVLALN
jgi:hypothetical protein